MSRSIFALAAACTVLAGPADAAGRALQLRASDGTTLTATLYETTTAPAPAVVLVHMLTRTKDDWKDVAERLQGAGATVVAVDLRGHGGSAGVGVPSAAMALDVAAAARWLAAQGAVRAVALVGASFGASAAAIAAGELPIVRGLALVSPASDYRGVRLDGGLKKYGSRPVLVMASSGDPYAMRTLTGLTDPPVVGRERYISPVTAHGSALLARDPDSATALVDWIRRTLVF